MNEVDCTGFDKDASAPDTQDKTDMITAGATVMDAWLIEVLKNPTEMLKMGQKALPYQYWTSQELLGIFKGTPEGENSRKRAGTNQSPKKP